MLQTLPQLLCVLFCATVYILYVKAEGGRKEYQEELRSEVIEEKSYNLDELRSQLKISGKPLNLPSAENYAKFHTSLGSVNFVTGEPTNEPRLTEVYEMTKSDRLLITNSFIFFTGSRPLIFSTNYEDCLLSDVIKYDLWKSINDFATDVKNIFG